MSAINKYGLTPQQEKFAQEVAKGKKLAEAYRTAYPKSKAWTGDAAAVNGSKLAVGAKVALRIDSLREKGEAAAVVTRERLLREIGRLAFCDPRKLTNEDGTFKPLHELDDDTAAAISSIEVDEYGKVKYKMLDKGPAQEKLAKYLGLYEKDNKQRADPMAELAKALLGSVVGPGGLNLPEPASE